MEDFQNNIFSNQMNNPQQNQKQMNLQFPQNDIMNQLNRNQGINPSQLYQNTPQQQLNQNNFNNINNINIFLSLINYKWRKHKKFQKMKKQRKKKI